MPRLRDVTDDLGSPYLRDHADNPVEWWAWGEDAFEHARRRDVPIFISVGYASCHWCHVMAHESFESSEVAQLLNDGFVSIKVDREERPDVDSLYMTATQMSSGHGGWPMSIFALPDGRPFFTGTYFPPHDRANQVGFVRLLQALSNAWRVQRAAVVEQADEIAEALAKEVSFVDQLVAHDEPVDLAEIRTRLRRELVDSVDPDGGFSSAPKFPHPGLLHALVGADADAREVLALCLDAMSRRGLYDHLGGGFARYCVDRAWHVPHFEKMLIDQAHLVSLYARAGRAEKREDWLEVARATAAFVWDELSVTGGLASSLDADAGGSEGAHVTWTPEEVTDALGDAEHTTAALRRWTITGEGDLDGRSVPRLGDGEPFSTPEALRAAESALRAARARRVQPARDDKVILEWNARFAGACLTLGEEFAERALNLLDGLHSSHWRDNAWRRTQSGPVLGTLGDLAALLDAELDAFEFTGSDEWLERARHSAAYLLEHFWDGPRPSSKNPDLGRGVFSASDLATDLLLRPKEIFDGVGPSGHALATRALARLGLIDANTESLAAAQRLVALAATLLAQHPRAVADLLEAAGFALEGVEIVVPGPPSDLGQHVRWRAVPHAVLITGENSSPLLAQRRAGWAYVCRGGTCQVPVRTREELDAQLDDLRI